MGVVEQSSSNVEESIAMLEESYSSFSINQKTLSVAPSQYEEVRAAAREDRLDAYAKVRNGDDEVLHITREDSLVLPSTTTPAGSSLEADICAAVTDGTGVDCSITDVEQATILGISNAEDDDCGTIYRLAILFEATLDGGTAHDDVVWERTVRAPQPIEA